MKKYLILSLLALIGFLVSYYYTHSWKFSVALIVMIAAYLFFQFGLEVWAFRNDKKQQEKFHKQMKDEHIKDTQDNPTLR